MNSKKSKFLALATTAATVAGLGFQVNAARTSSEVNNIVSKEDGAITDAVNIAQGLLGVDSYDDLLNFIDSNGFVDLGKFDDKQKEAVKGALSGANYSWEKEADGRISLTKKDGQKITADKIQEILKDIKNYVQETYSHASEFVTVSSGSGSSSASTQTGVAEVKLTEAPVAKTVAITKEQASQGTNVGTQLTDIINSTTNKAVMLESKDEKGNTVATWCVETKDIKDKAAAQNLTMKTEVTVTSTVANVPADVKTATTGKAAKVINFAEKNGTKLPFKAQTKINVGSDFANKKVDVYYIVNGKSYKCGTVTVDPKGQVICNFEVVGNFVLIAQ